jgi:energy-coupling factor transporter transmembrane protein EcfT
VASSPNALWGASLIFSALNIVFYYAELPWIFFFASLGIAVLVVKVIDG